MTLRDETLVVFKRGDRVHLAGFGTGIVREVRSGGHYAVELKGRLVVGHEKDLEPADAPGKARARRRPTEAQDEGGSPRPAHGRASLDLHGKTVVDALDALDAFINDALLDGLAEVRVIHGVSGGRLKHAVRQRLRTFASVRSFRVDPGNRGVTIVTFA